MNDNEFQFTLLLVEERLPRMQEIGVRSPVATDLSCENM